MNFAKVYSAQINLLFGVIVSIEVDISKKTLYAFNIVGLPDKAVDESKDRVSGAIKNSGFKSPKAKNQKIVLAEFNSRIWAEYTKSQYPTVNHNGSKYRVWD